MNKLFYGDCLTVMDEYLRAGSVDLIYLDPPFNSNRAYNAIYKDETGRPLPDQIEAFCDLWTLDSERERAIQYMPVMMRDAGIDDAAAQLWKLWLHALRHTQPRLLAYLSYMAERLLRMKPLLKPTGSIYLHCDSTASHYIKALMDAIFRHENFKNEIVWRRYGSHNDAGQGSKHYGHVHDVILFYGCGTSSTWNQVFVPLNEHYVTEAYRYIGSDGRRYMTTPLTAPGGAEKGNPVYEWNGHTRAWRYGRETMGELDLNGELHYSRTGYPRRKFYLEQSRGAPVQDIWDDIRSLTGKNRERLGYATQKPLALLERIIQASSNEGDTVLDPFCGCATTLEAAHKLNRKWIGIDIAIHAVKRVAAIRLQDRLGLVEGKDFAIEGVPRTLEGARDLWGRDPYHFQKWAVEEIEGFVTTRRTGDGGVDGRLYFALPNVKDLQSMAIEVKGGRDVSIRDLRALRGVLENDDALLAGLIIMDKMGDRKTQNFARFMAEAGEMDVLGMKYPRMQMLTVPEILDGKRFHAPGAVARGTRQGVLLSP